MDTAESSAYTDYLGSMNPGGWYERQPGTHPADGSQGVPGLAALPAEGTAVRHARSGEGGVVTGYAANAHTGERLPTVRWQGQPAAGFTSDQGYSLDSLTNP
jgi:hypothetical protein